MPQPTVFDVHVDRPLTNISIAYIQEQDHFIATKVFPVLPVDKKSNSYRIYTQADWFRDEAQPRAPGAESVGSGYNLSTDTYNCITYAIHKDVDDEVVQNSDTPLQPFADATRFVTQKMLLKQEQIWVNDYFGTGKWGTDVVGGSDFTYWDTYATSDPIDDVESGKETILQETGYLPNALVLGYQVYRKLKHHPQIIDRIKYTQKPIGAGAVTPALLAALFGLDNVYVARAIKNSAVENATASYSFFHGKNALLVYAAPAPSLLVPSGGYTFTWRGVSDGLGANVGITRFRMQERRSERIEAQMAWDNKLVASGLGYFFSGAVS